MSERNQQAIENVTSICILVPYKYALRPLKKHGKPRPDVTF